MRVLVFLFWSAYHFANARKIAKSHPRAPAHAVGSSKKSADAKNISPVPFPQSKEEHRVTSLPGSPKEFPEQYAGLIPVDPQNGGALFYWYFKHPDPNVPLLFWVNGGPGCSSMYGALAEQGLYRVDIFGKRMEDTNPHAWSRQVHIVFVDQPVGVGYAALRQRENGPRTDEAYTSHFMIFLGAFYSLYPEHQDTPMFLTGESHGGHYIPVFSTAVLRSTKPWARNYQGMMLANPWVDPAIQFASYSDYFYGLGVIQAEAKTHHDRAFADCMDTQLCDEGFELLLRATNTTQDENGQAINMYDSRIYESKEEIDSAWPTPILGAAKYLSSPEVRKALHVDPYLDAEAFEFCKDDVYANLIDTEYTSTIPDLALALQAGKRVLIFSGLHDIVCNHLGTQQVANAIPWENQKKYQEAVNHLWIVRNKPAGYVKTHSLLTHVVVVDSGHMVLFDRPDLGADLLHRFLTKTSFQETDFTLPIDLDAPICYATSTRAPVTNWILISAACFLSWALLFALVHWGRKCWLTRHSTPNRKPIYHKMRHDF